MTIPSKLAHVESSTEPANADPSELINLELLEISFAPKGYFLTDFFYDLVNKNNGAYLANGQFISFVEMEGKEGDFVDMVYRHCGDFIEAQNIDDESLFQPLSLDASLSAPKNFILVDNTGLNYPVPEKIRVMNLVLERFYWELRQARADRLSSLSISLNPDTDAFNWIENKILAQGRKDADLTRRLITYADQFKNALLEMRSWYGLYSYYINRKEAVRRLLNAGFELRTETAGLTSALIHTLQKQPDNDLAAGKRSSGTLDQASQSKPRPYSRGEVTIKQAAAVCLVSESAIRRWEKGQAPEGWPGRTNAVELRKFANLYRSRKATARTAAGLKRAVPITPEANDRATQNIFEDD